MKELTQKLSNGEMVVQELPMPQLTEGMVLVKNHFSLISAGTEESTVKAARQNIVAKAKSRPQQVAQVMQLLKTQGIVQTYRAVMKKLEAYSPLGYSCAGEIIEVADDVKDFKVGDLVACGGLTANHAEIVSVPVNLCVKLRDDADLSLACYNTLGAIALQGVRQADMRLGETCAVIGLGLIGQIVCNLLKASGVRVIGIDINSESVTLAAKHCAELSLLRNSAGIEDKIKDYTNGIGVDAVIIAAATSSLDPINFAGAIARKKGTVVVLGAVPTGFDRDPYYYKKELQLKMSCSYGPGRYDINYEEKGIDYPVPYVRWTEKRNMEAFQELLATNRINLSYLTSHTFLFDDATKAYDMIAAKTESYLGIVLKYDETKEHQRHSIRVTERRVISDVGIAFIGAGSYAQGQLLPSLPNDVNRISVMTNSGATSKRVAERFKFEQCTSDVEDILNNSDVNLIFIATRHDTHAKYVMEGLRHGKDVYVEKPLCLNVDELLEIKQLCNEQHRSVMVGFNRRFSPHAHEIKKAVGTGKMSMIYRCNAGSISADSWIQDMKVGGGRIIGEACHFIDFMTYVCGSKPVKVIASVMLDNQNLNDTMNIIVEFENGSTGVVAYYANGAKSMPKEYFEVYCSGVSAIIDDFKTTTIFENGKQSKFKTKVQDKGQKAMMDTFFKEYRQGRIPIVIDEVFSVTLATFAALKSVQEGGMPIKF